MRLQKPMALTGIGSGEVEIEFVVYLHLENNIRHLFLVVSDLFQIDQDGMLGNDFFTDNKISINFESKTLDFGNISKKFEQAVDANIMLIFEEFPDNDVESSDESNYSKELMVCGDKQEFETESTCDSTENVCLSNNSENSSADEDDYESEVGSFEPDNEIDANSKHITWNNAELSSELLAPASSKVLSDNFSHHSSTYDSTSDLSDVEYALSQEDSSNCESDCDYGDNSTEKETVNKITLPKQSGQYVKVNVSRTGVGRVPELIFDDEVFTLSCVVDAGDDRTVLIPILNTSDSEVIVEVPKLELQEWKADWDNERQESVRAFKLSTEDQKSRCATLMEKFDFSRLSVEERRQITKLVCEFADIFFLEGDSITRNKQFEHEIHLKQDSKPIKLKQFRIPFALRSELERNIAEMMEADLIEESNSPWNLPTFLVPKKADKNGKIKYRIVTDMRRLNDLIEHDTFPLPVIDELLGKLGNAKYFNVLDFKQGFYQIGLNENSRKYTSFSANGKKYQYKSLPMGLKNAPAWFSRMMTKILNNLIDDSCLMYLDDVISFGSSLNDTIGSLRNIFERFREYGTKLNPEKCEFLKNECLFLGHSVSAKNGIFPDESKLDAIKNFKTPKNKKEVRSWLGLTGFYRKFIEGYGKIAAPLHKLTSPNTEFKWETAHEESFLKLKNLLINPPVLAHPDFSQDFILTTDASGTGISGVLSQIQDGKERPIGYCSRALRPREAIFARENATETELLAMTWSIKYFRPFLYGKKFKVFTDCQALTYFDKLNNANPRIMKYKLELEEYDFKVHYKPGPKNANADALSRMFTLRLLTDPLDREKLLFEKHDSLCAGHKGVEATINKIKDAGFTWPNLSRDVKSHVKKCKSCQTNKLYAKTKLPLTITDTPSRPLQKLAIDLIEALKVSPEGFSHILTAQDNFSKYIWAVPLRSKSAEEVAKALAEEIILKFGIPEVILSDQGTLFDSKLFKALCKFFQIKKIRTSSHHPQSNGGLERCHRSMKEYFRHFIDEKQSNWASLVTPCCFAYNTTRHSVTKFMPFEIMHGFKPNIPSVFGTAPTNAPLYAIDDYVATLKHNLQATYQIIRDNLIDGKHTNKDIYDKSLKPKIFKIGEEVQLLRENYDVGRSRSLEPKWLGPYVVLENVNNINYKIKMGRTEKIVHGNKLKSYYSD